MSEFKQIVVFIRNKLRAHSFKKNNLTFTRIINETIQVIELQKYSFKDENELAFTLNVGILVPFIYKKVFVQTPLKVIPAEGIINLNVGEILNNFSGKVINKHWNCNNRQLLEHELDEIINSHILPLLDDICTLDKILDFHETNKILSKNFPSVKQQIQELKLLLNK